MGSLTDTAEAELLDHVCNAAYSPVATVYLALATGDPTDAATGGSFNECADANNYAREAITFAAYASRAVTQTGAVTFNTATGSWGACTHWAVVDNSAHGAGDVLAHGALAATKTPGNGDTPSVASGQVDVTYSAGEISDYLCEKLLELMFRNQAYAIPDTFVALCDTTVADNDTTLVGKEVTGGSYAREEVDVNGGTPPTWAIASGTTPTVVDNVAAVTFTTATASWGTVVAVAICDAATVGNMLLYDNTMEDKPVDDGDTAEFAIGVLDLQMS